MVEQRLAIIIPTKDRAEELTRLLESIAAQEVKSVQIVIVDGGCLSVEGLVSRFSHLLDIDYVRKKPASLTMQRNTGVGLLRKEITLVCFLDDDTILEKAALKNMMRFWQSASQDIAGIAFNNISDAYRRPTLLERIFLVNADRPGEILRSGFQSKLSSLEKTQPVQWLSGACMVWRKEIFAEFKFDEWFCGYGYYEDLDFSYRIAKRYKLFVVAEAKIRHLNKGEDIGFSYSLGKMQVANKLYFVKKNPNLSLALCYWSCIGLLLNNVIKGLSNGDRRYLNRARGNIKGLVGGNRGRQC